MTLVLKRCSFSFPRRLNNNEFTMLEATGIFKKLPQLRKM